MLSNLGVYDIDCIMCVPLARLLARRCTSTWRSLLPLAQRFTDDPRHDPYVISLYYGSSRYDGPDRRYAATKGLLWSHMGWIFFKSRYDRMKTIESKDLDNDIGMQLIKFLQR